MKQIERASIMRIVSDIVKSDLIIDMQEIAFLSGIRDKYNIRRDDEIIADSLTMAEAFRNLRQLPDSIKKDIWEDLKEMATIDNIGSREASMYLLAVIACLSGVISEQAEVYSIEQTESITADYSQVLYIEGEYYQGTNQEISIHYREIINELRLVGFNFVYIPKVGEHYCSLSKHELNTLLSFLYPTISETQMEHATKQLTVLSTSDFCKSEIVSRMKISGLAYSLPSVMVRIGLSYIGKKKYQNFLVIAIDDDFLTVIRRIVDTFLSIFNPRILNLIYEEKKRFAYHGFHKQILDSLIFRKGVRSSVVIDIVRGEILLPEAETKINKLHRREKALYALFLLESSSGGINFCKPAEAHQLEAYNHRMVKLQRKYEIIYENFGGERSNAPLICLSENRLPMISLIKKQFRELGDLLYQPDDYLIQRNFFGNYSVAIPPELCLCMDTHTRKVCPFRESDFWRHLLTM